VLFVAAVHDDLEQQSVAAASVRGQHVDVLEVVSSRVKQQRAVVARATPVEVVGSGRLLSRDEVVGDVREVLDGLLRKPDCRVGGLETVDAIEHGLLPFGVVVETRLHLRGNELDSLPVVVRLLLQPRQHAAEETLFELR